MKISGWLMVMLLFVSKSYSQTTTNNIIPPSPTAAALAKYGDIPVSNYTGVPNISIPLYNISEKAFNVPITLSYHGSGVKVEEEASWTGLGWSMKAGGVITRSVRGNDDLLIDNTRMGYPDSPFPLTVDENNNLIPSSNRFNDLHYLANINSRLYDAEPDIFYFNIAGHSGKFFINKRLSGRDPFTFQVESQEKIKIEFNHSARGWVWVITTGDGLRYEFSTEEKTKTYNEAFTGFEPSPTSYIPRESNPQTITSSWYLDKIISPEGNFIDFKYTIPSTTGSRRSMNLSEERVHLVGTEIIEQINTCTPEGQLSSHTYFSSLNIVYDVYLKEINFRNGKIEFITSNRDDIQPMLESGDVPKKLDKIVIYAVNQLDLTQKKLKSFHLNYGYFTTSDSQSNTYSGKRLKLLSVAEKIGTTTIPPYTFAYERIPSMLGDIPDKYSKSKDHWGFFNYGSNTRITDPANSQGQVSTSIPPFLDISKFKYYNGADREPNEAYVKLGILKEIKYPTGGTTTFEYESNDFSNFTEQNKRQAVTSNISTAGPLVDASLYLPEDNIETIPINVLIPTVIKIRASFDYSEDFCYISPSSFGGTGEITIVNTGSTPYFKSQVSPVSISCNVGSSKEYFIIVPPGTYDIRANARDHVIIMASINYEIITTNPLLQLKGGGVRIAKISDYDGKDHAKDIIKKFNYSYTDNLGREKSSGVLMSPPNYQYTHFFQDQRDCSYLDVTTGRVVWITTYLKRSSHSNITLGSSAQGNPVGYSRVTISTSNGNENGKTIFTYINQEDQLTLPFLPNIPNQHNPSNGLLLTQTTYKKNPSLSGNPFQKVSEVSKAYANKSAVSQTIKGFKCFDCESIEDWLLRGNDSRLPVMKFYDNISVWRNQVSETITTYDVNEQNPITTTMNFYFDNPTHYQQTRLVTTKSDGKVVTKVSLYPEDYPSGNIFLDAMKSNFILTKPIEQVTYQTDVSGTKILNGQLFQFHSNGSLEKTFNIESINPIPIDIYKFSNSNIGILPFPRTDSISAFLPDSHYREKVSFDQYDDFGNVEMTTLNGGPKVSYQWGYNSIYPVMECKNAEKSQVFYESFEEGSGNSLPGESKTGNYSYIGDYSYSLSPITNGMYKMSYWVKSGSIWIYKINDVIVSDNTYLISLPFGQYDDIRIYPSDAQMTTYTYEPLVGMTSSTDAKGMTMYYEYDLFQRLKSIKDSSGQLLKYYDYHYKQP